MTANHPSRTWRGCPTCKPHKIRGLGRRFRDPWKVVRKLGKAHRLTRTYTGDQ